MTWRRAFVGGAVVVGALSIAAAANALAGERVTDRLTPRGLDLDRRVVVVAFEPGLGEMSLEVPHLRATYYRDIAVIAADRGARAIAYLDFDSLTFSDGTAGRSNVIDSEHLQEIGMGVLHDPRLERAEGRLPFLAGYRVDALASELAGVGIDSAGGSGRTVPALVRVSNLTDGALVDGPISSGGPIDRASTFVVPGIAFRLVELADNLSIAAPTLDEVSVGTTKVPLEEGRLRVAWSDELDEPDDDRIVLVAELLRDIPDDLFTDAVVLVGTVDPSKTEYIDTPVGPLPEVLVQANAVNTLLSRDFVIAGPGLPAWAASLGGIACVLAMHLQTGRRQRRWWPTMALAIGLAFTWVVVTLVAARHGILLDAVRPVAALVATALLVGVARQVEVVAERRRLRALFAQYVPSTVAA